MVEDVFHVEDWDGSRLSPFACHRTGIKYPEQVAPSLTLILLTLPMNQFRSVILYNRLRYKHFWNKQHHLTSAATCNTIFRSAGDVASETVIWIFPIVISIALFVLLVIRFDGTGTMLCALDSSGMFCKQALRTSRSDSNNSLRLHRAAHTILSQMFQKVCFNIPWSALPTLAGDSF